MKKTLLLVLVSVLCLVLFAGCTAQTRDEVSGANISYVPENTENEEITENTEVTEETEIVENNIKTLYPLPNTLDINNLDNCTVAVSLENGGAYTNDEGKMVMDLAVYTYELYDMVDIATLSVGDEIVRRGEEIDVTELERLDTGLIRINGGEENGGFELISNDNTVFFEIGMSDMKAYYELGKVTLPVSTEFVYTDASDLEAEAKEYYAGDFLTEAVIEYGFNPHNTSVVIEDGVIVSMKKVYTP